MNCAVKFCGGCNPKYDRGKTLELLKNHFKERVIFHVAEEGESYDCIVVIGGCTNCCASYEQYNFGNSKIKIWDENHIIDTLTQIEDIIISKSKN